MSERDGLVIAAVLAGEVLPYAERPNSDVRS